MKKIRFYKKEFNPKVDCLEKKRGRLVRYKIPFNICKRYIRILSYTCV